MLKIETLVISIGNINGCFDAPDSKSFKLRNPLLLRTYRPEKKVDSDHFRVFTSVLGGCKAAVADIEAKASGKNHRLTPENTLRDLLAVYGITNERTVRSVILFLQRALEDESISQNTPLSWLCSEPAVEEKKVEEPAECQI